MLLVAVYTQLGRGHRCSSTGAERRGNAASLLTVIQQQRILEPKGFLEPHVFDFEGVSLPFGNIIELPKIGGAIAPPVPVPLRRVGSNSA